MAGENPLRQLFKRMLHSPYEDPADYTIVVLHRGEKGDRVELRGAEVSAARRDGFEVYRSGRVAYIPYHRVLLVRKGDRVLYARAGTGGRS